MSVTNLLIFGPPVVLTLGMWVVTELSLRSSRKFRADLDRKTPAE